MVALPTPPKYAARSVARCRPRGFQAYEEAVGGRLQFGGVHLAGHLPGIGPRTPQEDCQLQLQGEEFVVHTTSSGCAGFAPAFAPVHVNTPHELSRR